MLWKISIYLEVTDIERLTLKGLTLLETRTCTVEIGMNGGPV
jgi:hypothetical protein